MTNLSRRAVKKRFDEQLQETRHKNHDKIKYRRRLQEEEEFDRYLEDELKRLDDDDTVSKIP